MFRQRWIIINIVPDPVQQVLWMISGFVEVFQEKMLAEWSFYRMFNCDAYI